MTPKFFESIASSRKYLTDDVYELTLHLKNPLEIDFQAGQFVNIRVDDGKEKIFFRSYSILSPPREKNIIKSCIKIVPDGRCSRWLSQIEIGTKVTFMGPIGMFFFNEKSKKETLFIATGTGITPLYSMIADQLEKGNTSPIHLVWGFRYEKDIFYQEEFFELAKKYPNFKITVAISRPQEGWTGEKGRVTDFLERNFTSGYLDAKRLQIYICGVGDMVQDVKDLCIQKGVPTEEVHFEKYN